MRSLFGDGGDVVVDGKPAGRDTLVSLMDVVTLVSLVNAEKTHYRVLIDKGGKFISDHEIHPDEAKYKLCMVTDVATSALGSWWSSSLSYQN